MGRIVLRPLHPNVPARSGARKACVMKRCMFVADSGVTRKVAKRILGGPDLAVVEAANGSEALDMCVHDMPDIIVVDGVLPDMPAV